MRRCCDLFVLCCALLAACGGGGGGGGSAPPPTTTLYVRGSGNDDDLGTSPDQALKTVARAAQLLAPAVTVYVGPGHYDGQVDVSGVDSTAQAPIQLIADSEGAHTGDAPGDVILDAGGDLFAVRLSSTSYVTIDGFTITGATGTDSSGIQVRSGSSNVTIRNCVISNASGPAYGIRVQNSNDVMIFNNLLFDNNIGIRIAGSQGARILNNSVVDNNNTGISIAALSNVPATGATLRNNIVQDSRNNVNILVDDGPPSSRPGYSGDFDLSFASPLADQTKTYRPAVIRGNNDVNEDALFVDTDNGDFHLAANSPAINAGTGTIDADLLAELFQRSTTADGAADTPPVDMGYHYPAMP